MVWSRRQNCQNSMQVAMGLAVLPDPYQLAVGGSSPATTNCTGRPGTIVEMACL